LATRGSDPQQRQLVRLVHRGDDAFRSNDLLRHGESVQLKGVVRVDTVRGLEVHQVTLAVDRCQTVERACVAHGVVEYRRLTQFPLWVESVAPSLEGSEARE